MSSLFNVADKWFVKPHLLAALNQFGFADIFMIRELIKDIYFFLSFTVEYVFRSAYFFFGLLVFDICGLPLISLPIPTKCGLQHRHFANGCKRICDLHKTYKDDLSATSLYERCNNFFDDIPRRAFRHYRFTGHFFQFLSACKRVSTISLVKQFFQQLVNPVRILRIVHLIL